jgi:Family of unknown function (DUF5627)/Domain of unknown function (DUF1735)
MIHLKNIFLILVLLLFVACQNEINTFDDYAFSSTYFSYQTPVRTLVLGDYDLVDNTKDNNHQFSIGVTIGGLYNNSKDRKVNFIVDELLAQNLYTDKGDTIVALPKVYYSLSSMGTIVVPKGKMQGYVDVQLTDAFFNDPNSIKNHYVIPLRIISAETDSILKGVPLISNPDRRNAGNWSVLPKDYTLYVVKYVNPYHGKYLTRGKDIVYSNGIKVDSISYRKKYVENDEIWSLTTVGLQKVLLTSSLRKSSGSVGNFKMELNFTDQTNCTLKEVTGSAYPIIGTGKFIKNGDSWGGKNRNVIYLSYSVIETTTTATLLHNVKDTLVLRDRAVILETFTPIVK